MAIGGHYKNFAVLRNAGKDGGRPSRAQQRPPTWTLAIPYPAAGANLLRPRRPPSGAQGLSKCKVASSPAKAVAFGKN